MPDEQQNAKPAEVNAALPDVPGQQQQNDVPLDKQNDVYAQGNSFKSRKLILLKLLMDLREMKMQMDFYHGRRKGVFDNLVKVSI